MGLTGIHYVHKFDSSAARPPVRAAQWDTKCQTNCFILKTGHFSSSYLVRNWPNGTSRKFWKIANNISESHSISQWDHVSLGSNWVQYINEWNLDSGPLCVHLALSSKRRPSVRLPIGQLLELSTSSVSPMIFPREKVYYYSGGLQHEFSVDKSIINGLVTFYHSL